MAARITFEDGTVMTLREGDTLKCFTPCRIVAIEYLPNFGQQLAQSQNHTVPQGSNWQGGNR